jgi:hypothetical protein
MLVGGLYQHITNVLSLSQINVVYMIHDGIALGHVSKEFTRDLISAGFHNNSMVFVIINHYPEITRISCQSIRTIFRQWQYQRDNADNELSFRFVDVLNPNRRHNMNRMNHSRRRHVNIGEQTHNHGEQTHNHGEQTRNRGDTERGQERESVRDDDDDDVGIELSFNISDVLDSDQVPGLEPVMEPESEHDSESETNTQQMASNLFNMVTSFASTFLHDHGRDDNSELLRIIGTLNNPSLDNNTHAMLDLISRGNVNNFFDNVPVTLTPEQINNLRKTKYGNVIDEYVSQHHDEQPYTSCPITREEFDIDSDVVVLKCGHYFSETGIKQWLSEHSTKCPCCNGDVRV